MPRIQPPRIRPAKSDAWGAIVERRMRAIAAADAELPTTPARISPGPV
jgi:hypothetical protein